MTSPPLLIKPDHSKGAEVREQMPSLWGGTHSPTPLTGQGIEFFAEPGWPRTESWVHTSSQVPRSPHPCSTTWPIISASGTWVSEECGIMLTVLLFRLRMFCLTNGCPQGIHTDPPSSSPDHVLPAHLFPSIHLAVPAILTSLYFSSSWSSSLVFMNATPSDSNPFLTPCPPNFFYPSSM